MFSEIVFISETKVKLKLPKEAIKTNDFMNIYIVFIDGIKKILGEIVEIDNDILTINMIGEFIGGKFINGISSKPRFNSSIRTISKEEMDVLASTNDPESFLFGRLPQYSNYPYMVNINELFGHHLAIFGNTGSGKSYGVSKILQSLFYDQRNLMKNSNIFIFDVHGEYKKCFSNIRKYNSNFICKDYDENRKLKIPVWLLDVNDIALLLGANESRQIAVLEKTMKLARIFSTDNKNVVKLKNHIIARAILSVMYSTKTSVQIRNEVFDILNMCNTCDISLDTTVKGLGYERNFKKCFDISKTGSFVEEFLIISFLETFINDDLEYQFQEKKTVYDLKTIEEALKFTIISENILNNESLYNCASILQVKLHSIITSENRKIFEYEDYIDLDKYLKNLFKLESGENTQIVLINMENYDDSIGKFIVKIFSKFIFEYAKKLSNRASNPFHIILEEAHRYIEKDKDENFLEYNIFSRIAKEGRKYGVLLTIITQRPTELIEDVISQCANFILFRTNHPKDIEYLKGAIPNIESDIIEKQKCIQPGNCLGFGRAFKLPMVIKMDMPNPTPLSDNANVFKIWKG